MDTFRNRMAWHPWVLAPLLSAGALGWLPFLVRGIRERSRPLLTSAAAYFVWFAVAASPVFTVDDPDRPGETTLNTPGGLLVVSLWVVSTVHTAKLRWRADARVPVPPPGPLGVPDRDGPAADDHASLLVALDRLDAEVRAAAGRHAAVPSVRRIDDAAWGDLRAVIGELRALVGYARDNPLGDQQFRPVEQMATDYLPGAVRALTAIQPQQLLTDENAVRANTDAREIVDTLRREVSTMAESVYRADFSRLEEQRRFLASRFHRSDDLQL